MLLDLVAAVTAAFALAGVAMALRAASRGRLPAWVVPVAAAAGMLGYAVWSEATWYARTSAALPPGVVVVRAEARSAPWRPWTYVRPVVERFSAVDARGPLRSDAAPGMVVVPVLLVARWGGALSVPALFDCEGGRRATLPDGAPPADPATADLDWEALAPDDPSLLAACAG